MRRIVLLPLLLAEAARDARWNAVAKAESFKFADGLQVVVSPDASGSEVTSMVWYQAGSSVDPVRKAGLALFVEHRTRNTGAGGSADSESQCVPRT
ncbi:MAG TPA: hypothetical protein PLR35_06055 [Burkholderiaceae bacterium]|nr:hypothetical protein [Burkholderiaceae bacterium]